MKEYDHDDMAGCTALGRAAPGACGPDHLHDPGARKPAGDVEGVLYRRVCFLFSLWLSQLYGPHAFLARPWITLGLAPALSVLVGAVCTGVILWVRRRMAAESPE